MYRYLLGLCFLSFAATPAFAHKMLVSVTVTDRAVRVVATYEDGEFIPAGAKVALRNESGTEIDEGVTDETGECLLSRPTPGVYTVAVDDRQGHFQKEVIVVRENESSEAHTPQSNRLVMAALGLGLIAGLTIVVMRMKKPPPAVNPT